MGHMLQYVIFSMKRVYGMGRKVFILTLFVVFSAGFIGGFLFNDFTMKKQDRTIAELQNHMGDLRYKHKDFVEVIPARDTEETMKNGAPAPAAPVKVGTAQRVENEAGSTAQPPPSGGGVEPLRSQIEQNYIFRLQSLASSYEGRLNGLVASAMQEYSSVRKSNPNADISPLINKYYSAGKSLEAECDSQVYSILEAFEGELRSNSFPTDAAIRAKETYEARKSARAGQIPLNKL